MKSFLDLVKTTTIFLGNDLEEVFVSSADLLKILDKNYYCRGFKKFPIYILKSYLFVNGIVILSSLSKLIFYLVQWHNKERECREVGM